MGSAHWAPTLLHSPWRRGLWGIFGGEPFGGVCMQLQDWVGCYMCVAQGVRYRPPTSLGVNCDGYHQEAGLSWVLYGCGLGCEVLTSAHSRGETERESLSHQMLRSHFCKWGKDRIILLIYDRVSDKPSPESMIMDCSIREKKIQIHGQLWLKLSQTKVYTQGQLSIQCCSQTSWATIQCYDMAYFI